MMRLIVTILLPFVFGNQCLENGEVAVIADDTPNEMTIPYLHLLKRQNLTALFTMDADRIDQAGVAGLMQIIKHDGHLLGLSLNNSAEMNSMSVDGFRGYLSHKLSIFHAAIGLNPALVLVSPGSSKERLDEIDSMGLLRINYSVEVGKTAAGNCSESFKQNIQGLEAAYNSMVLRFGSNSGCNFDDILTILGSMRQKGFHCTGYDQCIGLSSAYLGEKLDAPISFSLRENDKPRTTATKAIGVVSQMTTNGERSPQPNIYKRLLGCTVPLLAIGLLLFL